MSTSVPTPPPTATASPSAIPGAPSKAPLNQRPNPRPLPRGLPQQAPPPSPLLASISRWTTVLVMPAFIGYAVFVQDFGEKEHVFSPARRWLDRQKRLFYTLTPEQQRMTGLATADTAAEGSIQSAHELLADPQTTSAMGQEERRIAEGVLVDTGIPARKGGRSGSVSEESWLLSQGRLR